MIRSMIVAMATNRVIGRDGVMPWHLPSDLRYFRKLTMGHHLIMGRKTYDSIGRPLPGRTSIVLTRNALFRPPNVLVARSVDEAWSLCGNDEEVFVIGGSEIYAATIDQCRRLYLTRILVSVSGTSVFPEFGPEWQLVSSATPTSPGPDELPMRFEVYERSL